jgi:hypothetical protein
LGAAVLIGWEPATSPISPHLDSYTRALLVSKDRRHLLVTPWSQPSIYTTYPPISLLNHLYAKLSVWLCQSCWKGCKSVVGWELLLFYITAGLQLQAYSEIGIGAAMRSTKGRGEEASYWPMVKQSSCWLAVWRHLPTWLTNLLK